MIKAEWLYLWRHKLMLIVLIVIGFIPSIYAVTFLKSMWDPYGKLQDLPVAVVNHDRATTYQGTHLAAGKQLSKRLAKSDSMAFKVMAAKAADQGLKNGKYYMVITIPSDFSKNATTLMQSRPKKMVLHYTTSAGHNYTASKMTATAAKTAAQQVANQVTQTYAKTMFASIKTLSTGVTKAGKSNQKLASGSQTAVTADQQMTTGLNQLATSSLMLTNGTKQLSTGLNRYLTGVDQALNGSQQLNRGVQTYTAGVQQANTAAQKLATGAKTVQSGAQRYVTGVDAANTGAQQLSQNLAAFNQKTTTLSGSTQSLSTSSQQLAQGLQQLSDGSGKLTTNLAQLQSAGTASAQTTAIPQLLTQLGQSLSKNDSSTQVAAIQAAMAQVKTAVTANQNRDDLTAKVAATADAQHLDAAQKSAILATITANQSDDRSSAVMSALQQLDQAMTALPTGQGNQATQQLQALKQALTSSETTQKALVAKLATVSQGSQDLTAQLQQATQGFQKLNQGVQQLATQTPQLTTGVQKLATGATGLASGTAQLSGGSSSLLQGTSQLVSGNQQLAGGTQKLSQNGTALSQGTASLTSGLTTLAQQGTMLTSGASQLFAGTTQLTTGTAKLADGGQQLATGLTQVQAGNQQLATKLTAAGKKSKVKPTQLTYNQLAKPTTTTSRDTDDARNNGTGMAPYMMSVSLFVGALAFNMMFDMYTPRKYPKNGFRWWTGKVSILGAFAFGEAVLIESLLILIDGLAPLHPWATFGMILSIAVAFMSIVYWLNLVFGKVGAFFSMILLVLQLGGSAGTYPIQLSNHFFQAIHPWLPMSYAVSGLRNTLMVGNSAWPQLAVLIGVALTFSVFSMGFYARRHGRIKAIDFDSDTTD